MGRIPCEKNGLKKGPWTPEEDQKLIDYIQKNGYGNWRTLPHNAGLERCGKSCRLRWTNYLRPDIKRGRFSFEEEETIIHLHSVLGNKWSMIAARLPGRTDNEIKNYWNTHIRKRLLRMGIDPVTHSPRLDLLDLSTLLNPSLQISSQMNLSRLLGAQYINPELLKLATSLYPAQKQNQDFPLENQENVNQTNVPDQSFQNPMPTLVQSTNIQTPLQDLPTLSTTPFSNEAQVMMQPKGGNFSLDMTQLSSESCHLYDDKWQNGGLLMSTNFLDDHAPTDQHGFYVPDDRNMQFADLDNSIFQCGVSNLSTPMSSPTPFTSSSTYIHSSSTEDERESDCGDMKLNVPESMDDYAFMYLNYLDSTY